MFRLNIELAYLEVLHGHGGEVKEFVGDLVGAPQRGYGRLDVPQNTEHFVQYLGENVDTAHIIIGLH